MIKCGDFVEFTDEYKRDYTYGSSDARYGIAIEDTPDNAEHIEVRTTSGIKTIPMYCVQAYAWAGWIPEDLEEIYNQEFGENDWEDY